MMDNDTQKLEWLFLDLNSYFASVEQQENPALRGRPVAVVPSMTDSTCAIAASYEAKAYGVKTGTKIYDAKKMCPNLICVPAHHHIYVDYHHRILEEVIKHVPINKVWSIDELSSHLPARLQNRSAARDVAGRIKEGIWKNIGGEISCSIGVAPSSFVAKVATEIEKPNGLVILKPQDLPGPLFDLALTDLPGINVRMEARLNRAGVKTVKQFWNLSPKQARHIWGSVGGERFWYNLHGFHIPDQQTKSSMIGHSRVLDPALREPEKARLVARRLTIKAATRLRRQGFFATNFSLGARIISGAGYIGRWGNESRISPAQDNFAFLKALDELWDHMLCDAAPTRLQKISVTMTGLCRAADITPDLFDTQSEAYEKLNRRSETLSKVMDDLNGKYGAETIRLGESPKTESGYVGTKIAFSRIPDRAEFCE